MISLLALFTIVLHIAVLVTAAITLYIFGMQKNGSADPLFFVKQQSLFKWTAFCLFLLGWFFGDPLDMGIFPQLFKGVGIIWFVIGLLYAVALVYALFGSAPKHVLVQLRKFSIGNIVYGIVITMLSWLLWG